MASSASHLVAIAKAGIENLSPDQVAKEIDSSRPTVVDIREKDELLADGVIEGSVHAPRGMLEFYADPASPYFRKEFGPDKRMILVCASGGRSALGVQTLQTLGYSNAAHLDGGMKGWIAQGLPVVAADDGAHRKGDR